MSGNPIVNKLLRAAIILLFPVLVGVFGFMVLEQLDFVDALYMTIITMSTVGYEVLGGEDGVSPEGKVFIIFLIIFTIGAFFYVVSVFTSFVVEGEIRNLFRDYKVNKEIEKLKDHVIICGLGRNGRESVLELQAQNQPFIVVERDKEEITHFLDTHDLPILVLEGDATEDEILEKAQIKHARGIITALPDDAMNVFVTLTAKELNPAIQVVARASNESSITKLRKAGANKVVLPNLLGGRKMAKIMTQPALVDFVDMITGQGNFHLNLEEIQCGQFPHLLGKTLRDLEIRSKSGVLVLGMQDLSGKFELNPPANKKLSSEDKMFILGSNDQIAEFKRIFL